MYVISSRFTPFGLGTRRCKASFISLHHVKNYLYSEETRTFVFTWAERSVVLASGSDKVETRELSFAREMRDTRARIFRVLRFKICYTVNQHVFKL